MVAAGLLAVACLCSQEKAKTAVSSKENLSIETSVKFGTEGVFRGRKEIAGKKTFFPKVRVAYAFLPEAQFYAGVDAFLGIGSEEPGSRVNPTFGVSYDVSDTFTLDAGYVHHLYTSVKKADQQRRNGSEIYGGVIADVLLTPSLYFFYDFSRREVAIEGNVGYTLDLSKYSCPGFSLELGAKLGFDSAKRPSGNDYVPAFKKKGYCYYGASADLVYEVNSHAEVKIGVAYVGNSAKSDSWAGVMGRNMVWFSTSIDCSF
jgi:hypothetical protein